MKTSLEIQQDTNGSYRWFVFIICWLCGTFAGVNSSIFSVMLPQAIAEVTALTDKASISLYGSYVVSSFLIGWMLGGIFLGIISDRIGRVKTLAFSVGLYALAAACAGFSQNIWQLMFYRFATGIGVGGTMLGIAIFLAETWTTGSRAIAIGALVTSYQVGVFLSGFVAQIVPDWHAAFFSGVIPILLVPPILSDFLESHARRDAKKTTVKLSDQTKTNKKIGIVIFGSLLIGYWASLSWIPTWTQDLLGDQANGSEKSFITMINGLGAIGGCIIAGSLADAIGRKRTIMLSYTGAFAVSYWMFARTTNFTSEIYVLSAALGAFIGIAQGIMYIYLPELFEKSERAASVGLCLNVGRIVTVAAVLFMSPLVSLLGGYSESLSVFACVYLVGASVAVWAPETGPLHRNMMEHGTVDS